MLGGAWRESSANQISLEGVTAPAVEQALLFMYGGVCDLQPTCNLLELLTVADMYGIEALKDVVSYVLKMECCHFFHKPCSGCIIGVTDTLPLVETFALHEVGDKCYKWVTRHFVRMWANKGFAALPEAILNKCCDSAIQDIVTDNVIEMVIECDRLMGMIPRVRWSEPVVAMATKLMEACIEHLRNNFTDVIGTQKFLALGKSMAWGMSFMEDVFGRAIMTMPTDKGCKTYAAFQKLKDWAVCEGCEWTEDFQNMIIALLEKCETYMMLYINQLYETSDWLLLSPEMQAKMKEGGWYVAVGDSKKRAPKPQLTSSKPKSARPASSDAALYSAPCMGQRPRDLTLNKDATAKPKQPTPSPGVKAGMTKQKNRPISAPAAVSGASSTSVVPSVAASATKVTQRTKRATASGKLPPSGDMRKKVPQKSASAGGATSGHDALSRKEQQPKVTKSSKNQHIKQTSKNGQPTRPSSLAGSAQRSRPSSGGSSSVKDKENTHMHGKSGARCDVPMPRKKSVTKEKEKVKTAIPKMQETKPQPHRKPVLGLQTLNSHTVNTGAKSDSLNLKGRKNPAGIKSSASLRGHNSGLKYPTSLSSNCKDISPRKDHPASHMDNKDTFFENDNLFHKDSILSPGCFEAEKEATKALDLLCVALDEDSTDDEEKKVHGIHSASTAECESGSSVDGWDLAWPMYEEVSLIPLLGVRFVLGIRDPF